MKVFISYRREDTLHVAGRLYDYLCYQIGQSNVSKDVDSISGGANFRLHLAQAVSVKVSVQGSNVEVSLP